MSSTANVSTIRLDDGREVCLSYGVPVAAFVPAGHVEHEICSPAGRCVCEGGYFRTSRKWSVTTSRHATAYCGPNATTVPDDVFVRLIAPIAATGR